MLDAREVVAALHRQGVAEVDDSRLARALYASDASLYRVPPLVVVRPRHRDEVAAVLSVCRELEVPLTARGAGTSIAGNAVGPGVVVDWSRHLGRVLALDPEARTATVEPGTVHATLQAAATAYGLRFGPDPSTHTRCTVGGMVGNNACGARALGYGTTADNVLGLDVLTGAGERLVLREGERPATAGVLRGLEALVGGELATVRTQFGRFGRQVSGYALQHALPEHGFDVARMLVGSEGTLALVQEVTVRLVRDAPVRRLVVLGYADMVAAADAAPATLPFRPTACEGLDDRMIDRLRELAPERVPVLPRGGGWLLVEVVGDDAGEVADRAEGLVAAAGALGHRVVVDAREAGSLWRVREDGSGLVSRMPDGRPAHAGWEDAAVPPERLGGYLRAFDALLADHGLRGVPYGHFGQGCVHVRIDFPLGPGADAGRGVFRAFLEDAADLVAAHGGSLSGEHGDGRARSGLLPRMYSVDALALMARVKALFDPAGLLNPGVLIDPAAPEDSLRTSTARAAVPGRQPVWAGFVTGAHRCTGVAKCRAGAAGSGGATPGVVMCPSYRATGEEKDSTRGRARVLQELAQSAGPGPGAPLAWDSPEVAEVLDLCLSCKACARDCPTGVDLAALRSEAVHQRYAGRVRPRSHYALGWLPVWADLAARAPRLANAVTGSRVGSAVASWAAGVDRRRRLPAFARHTARQALARADGTSRERLEPVALWLDTFTDHFAPEVAVAAARVLAQAGYAVTPVAADACCGLTWVSTGQLDKARSVMSAAVEALLPLVTAGVPVVGLEPSCVAALRDDAPRLLGTEAARLVARGVRTLAEQLTATPGWSPPDLHGVPVVAQPHCHHHAVLGWDTDAALLARAAAEVTRVDGCCGLAGNWGAERGHHDVSMAVAELALAPALAALPATGVLLADGFSCRTQVAQLTGADGRRAIHLAQLLDRPDDGYPDGMPHKW